MPRKGRYEITGLAEPVHEDSLSAAHDRALHLLCENRDAHLRLVDRRTKLEYRLPPRQDAGAHERVVACVAACAAIAALGALVYTDRH